MFPLSSQQIEEGQKSLAEDRSYSHGGRRGSLRMIFCTLFFDFDILLRIPAQCFDNKKQIGKVKNCSNRNCSKYDLLITYLKWKPLSALSCP